MSEEKDPSKMLLSVVVGIGLLFVCYIFGDFLIELHRDTRKELEANYLDLFTEVKLLPILDDNFQQWG